MNPDMACKDFVPDVDPTTETDPLERDTDGDGIDDGAEDSNQNGKVDLGELNPNDRVDGMGPAAKACANDKLRTATFEDDANADLQLALAPSSAETAVVKVGGASRGLMGWRPTRSRSSRTASRPSGPAPPTTRPSCARRSRRWAR